MDSEILGLIVKELNKNGVNLIKHDFSNIDTFSPENVDYFRPGELPQIFDFSEHDKVFEDKIDLLKRNLDLQKDKRCEVEIERNYLAERINQLKSEITSLESHMSRLRERCMDGARRNFDRGNYGCLTILNRNGDLETESEKLKQRIAELESKETKKPINGWICVVAKEINGQEYVRLEDFMRVVNDLQEQNRLEDDWK